jgi:hypothetical protein
MEFGVGEEQQKGYRGREGGKVTEFIITAYLPPSAWFPFMFLA